MCLCCQIKCCSILRIDNVNWTSSTNQHMHQWRSISLSLLFIPLTSNTTSKQHQIVLILPEDAMLLCLVQLRSDLRHCITTTPKLQLRATDPLRQLNQTNIFNLSCFQCDWRKQAQKTHLASRIREFSEVRSILGALRAKRRTTEPVQLLNQNRTN